MEVSTKAEYALVCIYATNSTPRCIFKKHVYIYIYQFSYMYVNSRFIHSSGILETTHVFNNSIMDKSRCYIPILMKMNELRKHILNEIKHTV